MPVWFLRDGESFLVYSRPGVRKLRNIEANPEINLNLNSNADGGDVVRAECVAEVLADAPPATEVGPYLEGYPEGIARIGLDPDGFARAYSVVVRATPTRRQVRQGRIPGLLSRGSPPVHLIRRRRREVERWGRIGTKR